MQLPVQVALRLEVGSHCLAVLPQSGLSYLPESLGLSLLVISLAVSGVAAVVSVILSQSQGKDAVFSIQQFALLL